MFGRACFGSGLFTLWTRVPLAVHLLVDPGECAMPLLQNEDDEWILNGVAIHVEVQQ